jgi:hypothetical protein
MSTCAPWTLKNECANPACQHEKDSHHHGKDNCLALHCDCKRFFKAGEYDAAKKLPVSIVDDDEAPVTPKLPFWGP